MKQHNKYGFTLIELLVVVIIIAVLAAVAVPQYKKAVLKSRFSTLMPLAKSVAKGNEVYYLSNGFYADRKDKLDVEGPGTTPEGTQVNVVDSDDYNYVIASRTGLPNKYIVYQKHSPKFAENIHCEAEDKNIPAMELCKSLGGYEIGGSQTEGYITYVLEGMQGIDDTLPTSLTKLASTLEASLCAGKTNCTATVKGDKVIISECGYMDYAFYGRESGLGCMRTSYNAESTQTDKIFEKCLNGQLVGSSCLPTQQSGFTVYKYRQSGRGSLIFTGQGYSCIEGIGCATVSASGDYVQNGWYRCPSGQIVNMDTLECETY